MKRSNVSACDSSAWNQKSRAITTLETGLAPSSNPCLPASLQPLGPATNYSRRRSRQANLVSESSGRLCNKCENPSRIRGLSGREPLARFQLACRDLQPLHLLIVVTLGRNDGRVAEQVANLGERHPTFDESRGIPVLQVTPCRLMWRNSSWQAGVSAVQPYTFHSGPIPCALSTAVIQAVLNRPMGSPASSLKTNPQLWILLR
jgi:hypothetical protein